MKMVTKMENMLQLHDRIKTKNTGAPDVIAKALNISETEVYYLIQQLLELNPSLQYHHEKSTYYYADGFPNHVAVSVAIIAGNNPIQKLLNVSSDEPVTHNFLFA